MTDYDREIVKELSALNRNLIRIAKALETTNKDKDKVPLVPNRRPVFPNAFDDFKSEGPAL